jgi:hypothetical protein
LADDVCPRLASAQMQISIIPTPLSTFPPTRLDQLPASVFAVFK